MHFVIVGCGPVGCRVASELDASGHQVTVIDSSPSAFDRLPSTFAGQRLTGNGHERETLVKAKVKDAYGFAAVTGDDNANIIAARTAAEHFGVPHVVAKATDSSRAGLYRRFGIPTVSTVNLAAFAIRSWVLPPGADVVWLDETGKAALVDVRPVNAWVGVPVSRVEKETGGKVVFLTRGERVLEGKPRLVVQEGDVLTVATLERNATEVRNVLGVPPNLEEKA